MKASSSSSSSSASAEDRRWIVLSMVCLVLALGLPSLAVRTYVKLQVRKLITADDWIMVLAGVLWIAYIICQVAACANGLGGHTADLPQNSYYYLVGTSHNGDVVEALRFWYICTLFHVVTVVVVRISVGLSIVQYSLSAVRRWAVIVDLTVSSLASVIFVFLLIFQCSPIYDYWSRNRADSEASCYKDAITTAWFAFSGVSAAANAVLASFAFEALLEPAISWRKRLALSVLTVFTAATVTTSALQISQVPLLRDIADLTFSAADFASYALLTPSLALVAANLATLGPWLKELGWDMTPGGPAGPSSTAWRREQRARGVVRDGRSQINVMRGREDDVEAVLDAAVLEGLGRLESGDGAGRETLGRRERSVPAGARG